jgi:hypothetical protein
VHPDASGDTDGGGDKEVRGLGVGGALHEESLEVLDRVDTVILEVI